MQAKFEKYCYALLERFSSALLFFPLGIFTGLKYNEDNIKIIASSCLVALLICSIILSVMDVRRWRRETADSKPKTLSETESTH